MGRGRNLLTANEVKHATDGTYSDGGNLVLRVAGKSKKWVLRYQRDGKVVEIGLGGADRVPLKLAREKRDEHLKELAKGLDPRTEKRKRAAARRDRKTFGEVAVEVIELRRKNKWRANANDGRTSSSDDWTKNLTVDCAPIADRYVGEIGPGDIKRIVRPLWDKGHATSTWRLLNRIETVFDYAKANSWRTADNPATRALFQHILQATGPTGPKGHHPALDWRDLPAFIAALRASAPTMPALALEMMILAAARSGEVRGMLWDEIDFDKAVWTVPPERMKRAREHQVPLSSDAVALLRRLEVARFKKFVFPGRWSKGPVTHYPVWALVQRLLSSAAIGRDASPHGFRSSFRDWAAEQREPFDVAEACLAHQIGNATSQAYNRTNLLEPRRPIMERWARFLSGADANVVPLRRA